VTPPHRDCNSAEGRKLRFNREIAIAAPDRSMPLMLRVKP